MPSGVGAIGLNSVAGWSADRDDAGMVASVQELVAAAFADADLAGVLGRGDWYLVGSRARGFHDDLSDWDTALLTSHDPSPEERRLVGRAHREEDGNPIWADDMRKAIPLSLRAGVGEPYRALVAAAPYPADKWLPAALAATDGAVDLLHAARTVTDATATPHIRYDALWSLWRIIDARAAEVGAGEELLAGSPFHQPGRFRD